MTVRPRRLLLIDTCGAIGAVGLSEGELMLGEVELPGRSASGSIADAVRQLLRSQEWTLDGIDGVGVVGGPGSFTGLRTGLAFAKGLCEAGALPLAIVSRLDVLLSGAGLARGVAVLGAGRDGFYLRLQRETGEAREWLCTREEWLTVAEDLPVVFAEAEIAESFVGIAGGSAGIAEGSGEIRPLLHLLSLRDVIAPVQRVLDRGGSDVASSDANYVRGESEIYRKAPQNGAAITAGK